MNKNTNLRLVDWHFMWCHQTKLLPAFVNFPIRAVFNTAVLYNSNFITNRFIITNQSCLNFLLWGQATFQLKYHWTLN